MVGRHKKQKWNKRWVKMLELTIKNMEMKKKLMEITTQ
jgi:hypothetical protein